ncbi:MAG: uroporphyrinogen decarboxylase family protein [Candidatus Omnitrophota bacterium]
MKKTLSFEVPDTLGIADDFTEATIKKWRDRGKLPKDAKAEEYFGFDIRLFGFNQDFDPAAKNKITTERFARPSTGEALADTYAEAESGERFLALSCVEPFEHISGILGREKVLTMMAEDAGKASGVFAKSAEFTLKLCQLVLDRGYKFDGAWLWGDMGCKAGLIFSTDYYNAFLFDLHKEFCDFFAKKNLPVIFHSDGNIGKLIPRLIEAGVRALEPLESDVDMDIFRLKTEYGRDLVLFGGIDEKAFISADNVEDEIRTKLNGLMKGGGYIYHADSPITEDISFENYKKALELVRKYGSYV